MLSTSYMYAYTTSLLVKHISGSFLEEAAITLIKRQIILIIPKGRVESGMSGSFGGATSVATSGSAQFRSERLGTVYYGQTYH
jgi:hypothetical protein